MIPRRAMLQSFIASLVIGAVAPALGKSSGTGPVRMFDTDNDGTLDLNEVKKVAAQLFDQLDRDHDGTLDIRELAGRLSAKEFSAADPDRDGTLSKDEYLAVVSQQFKAANPDNDGTLDINELGSRAGRKLLRLLR